MNSSSSTWDGNTMAGPLSEVFAIEVTTAVARCRGCGQTAAIAELTVYGPDPGLVARCPGCTDVLLRVVRTPNEVWLDLGGISGLRMPVRASA